MEEEKKEIEVYVNVYKIYYSSFFENILYAFYIVFLFVSKSPYFTLSLHVKEVTMLFQ